MIKIGEEIVLCWKVGSMLGLWILVIGLYYRNEDLFGLVDFLYYCYFVVDIGFLFVGYNGFIWIWVFVVVVYCYIFFKYLLFVVLKFIVILVLLLVSFLLFYEWVWVLVFGYCNCCSVFVFCSRVWIIFVVLFLFEIFIYMGCDVFYVLLWLEFVWEFIDFRGYN